MISAAPREHTARRRPGRAFWLPGFGPTKALPGGGLRINAPFISPGDYFVGEVNYSHGAIRYNVNSASPNQTIVEGGNEAFGIASDCVYGGTVAAGTATGCQLTSAWNFNVGYDHYWTPQWHQSLAGNYWHTMYSGAANNMLCSGEGAGSGSGSAAVAAAGCNNDWSVWGVGSRLQWDVTKSFYLAVDVLYTHLDSATLPGGALTGATTLTNSGATTVSNESNWLSHCVCTRTSYPDRVSSNQVGTIVGGPPASDNRPRRVLAGDVLLSGDKHTSRSFGHSIFF